MRRPRLDAVEGLGAEEAHLGASVDEHDLQLLQRAGDNSIHVFLREPAIIELARRKDSAVLDICEELLNSNDIDGWSVGVNALAEMKTAGSLDRLVALHSQSNPQDKSFIMQRVAQCLTSNHAASFGAMVRGLSIPCEIDVSLWSSVAKAVLGMVCARLGLTMTFSRVDERIRLVIR